MRRTIEISNIYNIRSKIKTMMNVKREAEKPVLRDKALIPDIYAMFCKEVREKGFHSHAFTIRQVFLFVVLYMYAPGVLFGDRLPDGLRKAISDAIGVKAGSAVSNLCKDLFFLYSNYSDFRKQTEEMYNEICERIGTI